MTLFKLDKELAVHIELTALRHFSVGGLLVFQNQSQAKGSARGWGQTPYRKSPKVSNTSDLSRSLSALVPLVTRKSGLAQPKNCLFQVFKVYRYFPGIYKEGALMFQLK